MRAFLAALALAAALIPFTAANASEPLVQLAQMARDVTDAVRKQREERRERPRTDEHTRRGSKR
jgi:hypothetical protein